MRHEIGFFARTNCERKKNNVCGIRKKKNLSTQRMKKYSNKKKKLTICLFHAMKNVCAIYRGKKNLFFPYRCITFLRNCFFFGKS